MTYAIDPRLDHDIRWAEDPNGKPVLKAYRDSLGYWTAGTGHLLLPQDKDWEGYTITLEQAEAWLDKDIEAAHEMAFKLPEWASCDTRCRCNALVELCFNMGTRWLEFHEARAAWLAKRWNEAADQMAASLWAKQVGSRAVRLEGYVRTGQYPVNL